MIFFYFLKKVKLIIEHNKIIISKREMFHFEFQWRLWKKDALIKEINGLDYVWSIVAFRND